MTTLDAVGGSFDFGRVVERTFRVIGQNLKLFVLCALVLVSLPAFLGTVLGFQAQMAGQYFSPFTIIGALLSGIGSLVLQGLVVHAVVARLNGQAVSLDTSLKAGTRYLLPLLGLAIIQGLGLVIGFLLFFVPGLILAVMWSVSAPSLVVENRGVFESLQRSRDLTRGHRWAIFGLFVVYVIVSMVVGAVAGGIGFAAGFGGMSAAAAGGGTLAITPLIVVSTLISSLINGAQGVLAAAGVSSIYYELRTNKEGVAPQDLASVFD